MKNRLPILGISVICAFILVIVTIVSAQSFSLQPEAGKQTAASLPAPAEQQALDGYSTALGNSIDPGNPIEPGRRSLPGQTAAAAAAEEFPNRVSSQLPPGASILSQPLKSSLQPSRDVRSPIYLHVNYAVVEGYVAPEEDVHLVLNDGIVQTGEARMRSDSAGYYWSDLMDAGYFARVHAGDELIVEVAGSPIASVEVPDVTAVVYPITDTIIGQISGVSLPADLRYKFAGTVLL